MGIGVFSTLAAGLIVTQVLLRLYALGLNAKSISMLPIAVPALSRALHPNIDWLRFRFVFWGGALVFGMLGDMILAHGVCGREAADKGVAVETHAAHLLIHGLLHLAGYDHETGEADAAEMEGLETKALALMGITDPYAALD
jgi:hypothetical protein